MKKVVTLIVLLLFAVSYGVYAQKLITGKTINGEDGLPMPGVFVVVKGTTIGMVTDKDGNFALRVPDDAIIVVSYMGFKAVEIPAGRFTYTQYNITLQPDAIALGYVVVTATRRNGKVVTAMGIERDPRTLPYAITHLSGDELRRGGGFSIAQGLIGRVPGLKTYMDRDGVIKIAYIRGIVSLQGPKPPLFVINGVPLPEDPSSWINLEVIESVTVLRGANAAMLYGSDGAGGAILITTKR